MADCVAKHFQGGVGPRPDHWPTVGHIVLMGVASGRGMALLCVWGDVLVRSLPALATPALKTNTPRIPRLGERDEAV